MEALALALIAVLILVAALFVIEIRAIVLGKPTISEGFQRLNQRMDKQLLAGIFFLFGALAGWFIAHFTSRP